MKINILASLGKLPGGANRNFLEFADQLVKKGHQVTVIRAADQERRARKKRIKGKLRRLAFLVSGRRIRPYRFSWTKCTARTLIIPVYREQYLPDADITLFGPPSSLTQKAAAFSPRAGRKVLRVANIFFDQNPSPVPPEIMILASSSVEKELLAQKFPGRKIYLLNNGVNPDVFSNPAKVFRKAEVIGMLFYQKRPEHKGLDDAVAAFEIVRRKYPLLKFRTAGFRREKWLPSWIEFWDGRNQKNLAGFYSSLDIFLFPSRADASPNPPLEAMACQAALVMTEVGGLNDYLIPGETGLVSPAANPESLAANIISLVENPPLLRKISLAGYRKAQEFSYQIQAGKMEAIFREIIKEGLST
jgi:glycosyltransferase involved in cell wall biosynthesis